jgi:hypothetical protein
MSKLNIAVSSRAKSYEPRPFIGAPPLLVTDAAVERWRTATSTFVNLTPSTYARPEQHHPAREVPLAERLFNVLAAFKMKTAMLAAAHFTSVDRARLFRQLDSLLDAETWESTDAITTEASFTTLLRMILFLGGRRPGLGLTSSGNFIATWTEGADRLTIECKPEDKVRWVLVQDLDGQIESAAGETTIKRLPEVLLPYDPAKRWFPNATHQATA